MRELLSRDPSLATVPDIEGHTPLMIAADRACESPSPVTELVMQMLQQASTSGRASGSGDSTGSAAWPTPASEPSGSVLPRCYEVQAALAFLVIVSQCCFGTSLIQDRWHFASVGENRVTTCLSKVSFL